MGVGQFVWEYARPEMPVVLETSVWARLTR